jgi:outer membrane receptor protein involved in Fe transport
MKEFRLAIIATLVLCVFGLTALAQTSKGFVVGTVVDPNGAGITGATIKITNAETGVNRTTVSQENGSFRLDAVDPGSYTVEISAGGFKTSTRANVLVAAAQTADVSGALEVGNPNEVVTVSADNLIELQTTDGTRVNTLNQREITELPVVGLNPVNLVFTLPGVVDPGALASGFVQGTEFSVNGLRPRANNQLIDGLENNDNSITGQSYQPTVRDGYSEVTILGSNFSAEYGRAGGAVVNVITRSGSNAFHGSVYDINQNSVFSSLTPGQIAIEGLTEVPKFNQNTLGFSVGGPIKKNKLFFFGTFQDDLFRAGGVSGTAITPTAAGAAQLRALVAPGVNPALDQYLAIVSTFLAPTADRTIGLEAAGTPNRTLIPFGTASRQSTQPVNTLDYIARVDWTPTSRDSFSFRYLRNDQTFNNQFPGGPTQGVTGSQFPGFEVDVPGVADSFYASYTRNFSAATTNEFRFGRAGFDVLFAPRDASLSTGGPQIAINTGSISTVGLSSVFPQGRNFKNYQFQDTITHTVGNHTFRVGADILAQRGTQLVPINTRGTLSYTNGGGFTALGNFVQGFSGPAGAASKVFGNGSEKSDVTNQAYFVNDSWRVRENLSLTLGLRYENFGVVSNNAPFPAFGGTFSNPLTRVEERKDNNNFAPRLSFAYTPHLLEGIFGKDLTVIRGGFAVNYDVFFNNILSNTLATFPNSLGATTTAPNTGRGLANFGAQSLPTTGVVNPTATVNSVDPNLVNPMTYVWNFGIQRELPGRNIVDVSYVGSRGTHLFISEQANPGVNGVRINPARGSITIRTNGGDSIYHSLQARLERGFSSGFLYRLAYTYSKAIDNTNSEVFTQTGGDARGSDPFNRRADRSVASYDVPHRLSFVGLWDSSNMFKDGWKGKVLGGFTFGTIYRIQSGNVETPFIGGADLNGDLNAFNDRPSLGNPNAPIDTVAFSNAFNGTTSPTGFSDLNGNDIDPNNAHFIVDPAKRTNIAGRNTLRSPWVQRLDTSLSRSFKIPFTPWETDRFEIRVEFFNVLNHPSFSYDNYWSNGDVFNSDFAQPRENQGTNRTGRIQLRYTF